MGKVIILFLLVDLLASILTTCPTASLTCFGIGLDGLKFISSEIVMLWADFGLPGCKGLDFQPLFLVCVKHVACLTSLIFVTSPCR